MKRRDSWKNVIRIGMMLALVIPVSAADIEGTNDTNDDVKPELLTPVQQRMQQEISVDFLDTPIDDVLNIMAKQADIDIIKSPKVNDTITATLTDVPLSEALNNILDAHGYAYIATDNIIRVMLKDEAVQQSVLERMDSRVFHITYADVTEVTNALKQFISDRGSISFNPGTSHIIVADTESKIKDIAKFIEQIDCVTPQILVEAKIYDITSTDNLDLGFEWQAGTNTGYLEDTTAYQNGTPLTSSIGNTSQSGQSNPFTSSSFSGSTGKTSTIGMLRYGIINSGMNIDVALHASQEDIRAKLLANPRIMVVDNQEAEIKIIEEIPYQELTESSAGGSIGTTSFREVGVELRVTPHLTRDGLIRMILNPKFSVQTGDVQITGGSTAVSPQPIVASREEKTTAMIRDRETVVIGGLKKQDVSQQTNKIPLLGDLPLLGGLFRFEGESTVNSELVIFITPQVVQEPTLTAEEQQYLDDTVFVSPRVPATKLSKKDES